MNLNWEYYSDQKTSILVSDITIFGLKIQEISQIFLIEKNKHLFERFREFSVNILCKYGRACANAFVKCTIAKFFDKSS